MLCSKAGPGMPFCTAFCPENLDMRRSAFLKDCYNSPICSDNSRIRKPRSVLVHSVAKSDSKAAPAAVFPKRALGGLALGGAIMGPLLDGIHGTVHLLEYKVARVDFLGLHSSLTIPVLLGAYYLVVGALYLLLDSLAIEKEAAPGGSTFSGLSQFLGSTANSSATQSLVERQSWPLLALNTGAVAALLYLSAVLYSNDVPYYQIGAMLAACDAVYWRVFDRTKQGLGLALLCAVAAPLSELVLINVFGLWDYPHPNIFGVGGVPSWVSCCYFFYTPAVGNLARLLSKQSART